jgi:hypothetical protein
MRVIVCPKTRLGPYPSRVHKKRWANVVEGGLEVFRETEGVIPRDSHSIINAKKRKALKIAPY